MALDLRTDLTAFIETALAEVCFGNEVSHPLEATIDRYFAPDYTQRTDGALCGRDGFAAHIRALRALAADGNVKVSKAIRDGNRIADRHEVTVTRQDGTTSRIEVYLFGELAADGRLLHVEEITRVIDGDQADARLAQVR
jgi:predicted SnoaL-like aldol condensation-catalyzing enzyme